MKKKMSFHFIWPQISTVTILLRQVKLVSVFILPFGLCTSEHVVSRFAYLSILKFIEAFAQRLIQSPAPSLL